MLLSIEYIARGGRVAGWRDMWAKRVTGFRGTSRGSRCLVGYRVPQFGFDMPANEPIAIPLAQKPGDLFYFAGESAAPGGNFHIAGAVNPEAPALVLPLPNRDTLIVRGLDRARIDGGAARALFPARPAETLACPAFQFGAQVFGSGL